MKNMKRVVLLMIVGMVAGFSGCVDETQPPVIGKQVWKAADNSTITLYSDGTFLYQGTEIDLSGVYRWDGEQVVLALPMATVVLERKGDTLVCTRDGQVWRKQ